MQLINHTIAENGDIIYDGVNMSNLADLPDAQLDVLADSSILLSILNMYMSVSQKVMMNSIYGATANAFYYFCSVPAADDITAEGRFYVKKGASIINEYFKTQWHLDTELHEYLRNHKDLKDSFTDLNSVVTQMDDTKDYVMYIDTDSLYVTFEDLFQTIGFEPLKEDKFAEFIMEANNFRFRGLFDNKLGSIISQRHGENFLKFDLESVSETTIFVKKKKYVMSYKMEDGKVYDDSTKHIKGKGIEIIQSTMSPEVKAMIKFMIVQLFKSKLDNSNYKMYMRMLYKQFCKLPMQQKCSFQSANTYDKNVLNDTTGLEFAKGADVVVKGMALYNFKLKQNNLLTTYNLLKGGKVAWYYTADGGQFAFPIGDYPTEIGEPMDEMRQFIKLVGNPVARLAIFSNIDVNNPLSQHMNIEI
jgi:hypothetical protein